MSNRQWSFFNVGYAIKDGMTQSPDWIMLRASAHALHHIISTPVRDDAPKNTMAAIHDESQIIPRIHRGNLPLSRVRVPFCSMNFFHTAEM